MSINIFSISVDLFSFILLSIVGSCSLVIIIKRYAKKNKPYIHDPVNIKKLEAAEQALNNKMSESKNIDRCIIATGSTLDGHDFNWANQVVGLLASQGIDATYKSFDTAEYISRFHILVPVEQRSEAAAICAENNINMYK